jgi:YVTN family beta-propeller protein
MSRNLCTYRRPLVALVMVAALAVCMSAAAAEYLGPTEVVAAKDGNTLYVLNQDAGQIAVVDVPGSKVARTIACPAKPNGLAISPDGSKLYVPCGVAQGTVAVIDAASGNTAASIAVGHSPCGPSVSPDSKRLYVCNRFNNNVSVIDLEAGKEVAKVAAVREPVYSAVTPDGKTVLVSNLLPIDRCDSYDVAASISVIDAATNQVSTIRLLNGSTHVLGIVVSPDGKYAYVAHILSRYQMPTTQLERGWMNTNALSIVDVAAKKLLNTVLLDDVDLGAANPWGVGVTADGKTVCVSHQSTHELSVINIPGVIEKIGKLPANEKEALEQGKKYDTTGAYASFTALDVPNDLAFLVDLRQRVKLQGRGPRGVAVAGNKAFAVSYFSDLVNVVDLDTRKVSAIALGPAPVLSVARKGDLFFHDADLCFQHWQSCASCHPDARMDALNWDLMNDGMGNPKNNKSMLLAHKTPPSMSLGIRATAEVAVRSGITHIQFAVRPEEDAVAIDEYLKALQPVPSPYLVNGQLSDAAKRGKELFGSDRIGCFKCHPEPLYTDLQMHDVGSKGQFDREANEFDTPSLVECWRTAPYNHDGHWLTVKELIKEGKHGNKVGQVEKLTDQELNDLVEFVLSL